MGTASLVPGETVRVIAGTTVHVWDFEACVSDTWLIDGETAEHEFVIKSVAPRTVPGSESHLVLVQPGFEHEYELRVRCSEVTNVALEQQHDLLQASDTTRAPSFVNALRWFSPFDRAR